MRSSTPTAQGTDYTDAEVAVGCGAMQVIFNAPFATLEAGCRIIVATPNGTPA
ncbi:hypothetical protein [Streptomyces decoyicus]|uniref:hypothetical protein n=1 Tax=Streptomyces decoyicus TaxID=249567 RepID=UPI002E183811|nr:hypothetical protein OG532_20695 [Streptomyces decoyicus]